jgi:hypothetical protein
MAKNIREMKLEGMIDDIKYLEDLGLEAEEILESILSDDNGYTDNKTIVEAFKKCGYTVSL